MPTHPRNVIWRQGDFCAAAHAKAAQARSAFKTEGAIRRNLLAKIFDVFMPRHQQ